MPGKEASVFNIFSSVSVSGAQTFTSSITANIYRDNVGYQIIFSGSPTGTLQINVSNNYNLQQPQSGNVINSSPGGDWTTLASVSMVNVVSPVAFNMNQVPFAFIQCQFVSSTASGTITGWISSKSLGS